MTWKTSKGERTLQGAEAKLFASCLATMIELSDDKLNWGLKLVVGPFEGLTDPQKYTVLEEVAKGLLTSTPTCPELTALNESAIYYVYSWLKDAFDDVEDGEEVWGELLLEALDQITGDEQEEYDDGYSPWPKLGCLDKGKWEWLIEFVADHILWDRDFEMADMFPAYPGYNGAMAFMNIDQNYFKPLVGGARRGAKDRVYDLVCSLAD